MQRSASKLKPIAPRPAPSGGDAGARAQPTQQQQQQQHQQQHQQAGVPPGTITHHNPHHPAVPPGAVAVQLPYPPPGFHHHPSAHPHPAYAMAMPIAHPAGAPHAAYAVHPHAAAVAAGYHHHLPHHAAVVSAAPQQHHPTAVHATPVSHLHHPQPHPHQPQHHPQLIQAPGPTVSMDPRDYVWGTPAGGQPDQTSRSRPQVSETPQTQQLAIAHHPQHHHHQHPGTLALPQQQQQAAQQYALAVSGHMQQAGMMISYTTAPHGARPMAIPMAIPQHLHSMPYAMQHATGAVLHAQQPMTTSQPMPTLISQHQLTSQPLTSQAMPALLTNTSSEQSQQQSQQQQQQASQQQQQASTSGQQPSQEGQQRTNGRTDPATVTEEQRNNDRQQQEEQQQHRGDTRESSLLLGDGGASGGLSLEERGNAALMMDDDIDLDETLKKLLESDDPADNGVIMTADGMKLMADGTSPSDQSTNTAGAHVPMDDGNKSGAELLGQNEEPNFESWHQGIYCMHSHGDLDELDLDFANTLESVELSSSSRPMKRAKSMASLAGGMKKVSSYDNLLLNVSQPQALRAIRTFLTKSSLPEDQRNAALSVLELLKQQGNNAPEDPVRSASETGLPLSMAMKRDDSTNDLFK